MQVSRSPRTMGTPTCSPSRNAATGSSRTQGGRRMKYTTRQPKAGGIAAVGGVGSLGSSCTTTSTPRVQSVPDDGPDSERAGLDPPADVWEPNVRSTRPRVTTTGAGDDDGLATRRPRA